jgi:hypothetical protein
VDSLPVWAETLIDKVLKGICKAARATRRNAA